MTIDDINELKNWRDGKPAWCEKWMYTGIRHLIRNCDIDHCDDHEKTEKGCERPDIYDGPQIAAMYNILPDLLAIVAAAVEFVKASEAIQSATLDNMASAMGMEQEALR